MLTTLASYNRTSIIADKIGVEGGGTVTNIPDDRGGLTKYGVTMATLNNPSIKANLTSQFQWDGTMEKFTSAMAVYVYTNNYWNVLNLDTILQIHPLIADKLFDIGINMGVATAGQMLQQILNVCNKQGTWYPDMAVDGRIGQTTCVALTTYLAKRGRDLGISLILTALLGRQTSRYIDLALNNESQETFEDGWLSRVQRDMGHYSLLLKIAV